MNRRALWTSTPLLLATLVFGCGSRTELSIIAVSKGPLQTDDPCASAVLAGAPKPMTGACSTRDGRVRGIAAPNSPHVIWQTAIPYEDDVTSIDRQTTVVTDNAHHAYVGSFITIDGTAPQFRRVDTRTGAIEWAAPSAASTNGLALLLLQDGSIDLTTGGSPANLLSFASTSGTPSTSTLLPFSSNALNAPAVGTDGSLYFFFMATQQTSSPALVSSVRADLSPRWTSADLMKTGPTPIDPTIDNVEPTTIALGPGDTVYVAMTVTSADGPHAIVNALDPASGKVLWTKAFHGTASAPVVSSEGSIALVVGQPDSSAASFILLDPSGVLLHSHTLTGALAVIGVTVDGAFFIEGDGSTGSGGVTAIDADGNTLWTRDVDVDDDALIATNGIVIVKGEVGLTALDVNTGAVVWHLSPPHADQCISSGTLALTSDGAVIALQCDGTLFAAAD